MEMKMSDSNLVFDTFEQVDGMKPCKKRPIVVHAKQIPCEFRVNTLEGNYKQGKPGDYLMKGIDGELYICDQAIFEKTYDFLPQQRDKKSIDQAAEFIRNYSNSGELFLVSTNRGWTVAERNFVTYETEWTELFGPFSSEEIVYLKLPGIKEW